MKRARLLAVAHAAASERGWPWLEPVAVDLEAVAERQRVWAIRTNCHNRGMNIRIVIRESDLAVLSAGFLPR